VGGCSYWGEGDREYITKVIAGGESMLLCRKKLEPWGGVSGEILGGGLSSKETNKSACKARLRADRGRNCKGKKREYSVVKEERPDLYQVGDWDSCPWERFWGKRGKSVSYTIGKLK